MPDRLRYEAARIREALLFDSDKTVNHEDLSPIWSSVMDRALSDLSVKSECFEAAHWFISTVMHIGSFEYCCLVLDIEPSIVRTKFKERIYVEFN